VSGPEFQAGCKAYLLELLYHLARHFRSAELARTEYIQRQQQSKLLGKLVAFLEKEYTRKVPVAEAAAVVEMSESQFMKFFKRATGMSFVTYVIRARLARAYELLTREDFSIAEVSTAVGFSDQSYFDRKFKEAFHQTPRQVKANRNKPDSAPAESS
jgi:transcriptional regulator GlxA family with amidase domain